VRRAGGGIEAVTVEVTDADLIARARAGDGHAYGMLVARHQTVAFRTAHVITGHAADAEDAAQEAFIKARAALGRFREGAPFRPWLLTIVANEARNRRRAAGRRLALAGRVAASETRAAVPLPEAEALAGDDRRELAAALKQLAPDHREVIVLRYLLDLSEAECAAALRCRPGTVKSRLSRALAKLRTEMETARV
jgi:RNA polymerase sigma factor (sigma-70 family)